MRTITLHDTRTGQVRPLEPHDPGQLGLYVCGPTVYGRIHVGNARPFVVFSLLNRFLVHEGYRTRFVTNITDVNDKIYAAAGQRPGGSQRLAQEMTAAYVADTDRLGLGRPDDEPRASEYIGVIIELIERLVERGHAYPVSGDVYFQVREYPQYGEISHRDVNQMDQGEGVEGAELKRDPLDFALWKAHKPAEDTWWDSPWGPGRPGWHIECSAMAEALLGLEFDIHGGGSDLVFPHHENEAAQTFAGRGRPLARLWVHNGMVRLQEAKMAKSEGNIFLLHEALDRWGRDPLIMYFVSGHYRQPVDFDEERMEQAAASVRRIREAARRLTPDSSPAWSAPLREAFFDALANDFNTPRALATAFEWVSQANRSSEPVGGRDLREMLGVLALENLLEAEQVTVPAPARELAARRADARAAGDWAQADRIREELRSQGWEVRDGPGGPELLPLT
ncbi:MAG TPA: cysteine--tRNA ligase [Solirubrobacteraceae bacterium]|nr:cysteine--tRNA ligase [Solirubrobacteraceae bacterium]